MRNLIKDKGRSTENYLKMLAKGFGINIEGVNLDDRTQETDTDAPVMQRDVKEELDLLTMGIRDLKEAALTISAQLEIYEAKAKEITEKIEKCGGILWN